MKIRSILNWLKYFLIGGVMIMSSSLTLSGCSKQDSSEIKIKELLSEKYSEEFTVISMHGAINDLYADCCPESEPDIIFRGYFNLETQNFRDEYVESIVSNQLEEKITPKLQEIFGECYVKPVVFYPNSQFKRRKDVTIESYVELTENPIGRFVVCINTDKYTLNNFDKEYELLNKYIVEINELGIKSSVELHFLSDDVYYQSTDYLKTNSKSDGTFDNIVKEYKEISSACTDGKLKMTKEEYIQLRKDV